MRIAYELARFRKVTVDEVLGMGPRPLGKTLAEIPGYKDAEFLLRKDDFIAWPAELWLQLRDSIVVIEMKRVTPQSLHFIAHGIELSMEADE